MIKGGRVIKYGVNQIRYAKGKSYFDRSLHAETALMRKSKPKELKGGKIYVYRFNNTTASDARDPKCSMPCPMCQHTLRRAGIGRVYCMNAKNVITTLRNGDLTLLQDDPCVITSHFLRKCGNDRHGKFKISQYRLPQCA